MKTPRRQNRMSVSARRKADLIAAKLRERDRRCPRLPREIAQLIDRALAKLAAKEGGQDGASGR
jgi:hypothetical protein